MKIIDPKKNLFHYGLAIVFCETALIDQILKILLHVFEDEIELPFVFEDFFEFDDIWMVQLFQDGNFSDEESGDACLVCVVKGRLADFDC